MTTLTQPASLVDDAILSRMSVRAFTSQAVPREVIAEILAVASRAPSGVNTQPWNVYVLQGSSLRTLVEQVCAAHDAARADPDVAAQYQEEYDYYPKAWFSPYIERRRENGWGLYGLLGIGKGDKDRMHAQHHRNFMFFDAPVGLIFTLNKGLGQGSLLDYGMFMQNIMLAARARGLHTCAQAAWNSYGSIIKPYVGADDNQMLVCGMALGYADETHVVNGFHTPRVPVQDFAHWLD